MKKHHFLLSILLGLFCSLIFIQSPALASDRNDPEGYWKVVNSSTGDPKSIIKIWKTSNQELKGKVIKIFAKNGDIPRCTACTGSLYNQPLLGMTLLSGLKPTQQQWGSGQLLNPDNGKLYSCSLRIIAQGNKLIVHNYTGLPYLGRADTWERVS